MESFEKQNKQNTGEEGVEGSCELCGSVGHKKEECPYQPEIDLRKKEVTAETANADLESFDEKMARGKEFEEMMKLIEKEEKSAKKENKDKVSLEKAPAPAPAPAETEKRLKSIIDRISFNLQQDVEFALGGSRRFLDKKTEEKIEKAIDRYLEREWFNGNIRSMSEFWQIIRSLEVPPAAAKALQRYLEKNFLPISKEK